MKRFLIPVLLFILFLALGYQGLNHYFANGFDSVAWRIREFYELDQYKNAHKEVARFYSLYNIRALDFFISQLDSHDIWTRLSLDCIRQYPDQNIARERLKYFIQKNSSISLKLKCLYFLISDFHEYENLKEVYKIGRKVYYARNDWPEKFFLSSGMSERLKNDKPFVLSEISFSELMKESRKFYEDESANIKIRPEWAQMQAEKSAKELILNDI